MAIYNQLWPDFNWAQVNKPLQHSGDGGRAHTSKPKEEAADHFQQVAQINQLNLGALVIGGETRILSVCWRQFCARKLTGARPVHLKRARWH